MKKILLFALFIFSLCTNEISAAVVVKYITLKVGESTKENCGLTFSGNRVCYITDPTIIEFLDWNGSSPNTYTTSYGVFYRAYGCVKGVKAGSTVIALWSDEKGRVIGNNYTPEQLIPNEIYVITVLDVTSISIPSNISLTVGESFTYSPIITDKEANTTLTWASSNTSVVTVGNDGNLKAVGAGITTITCTASNGVKAQSIVTVAPNLVSKITLNKNSHEMNAGDKTKLTTTITPSNATSKQVNWLSTNENIAQVDDSGNVTAIGPGYCTIYAKADDGSGKFAKCLVHVNGTAGVRGDMNGDGQVTVTDASAVIDIILDK